MNQAIAELPADIRARLANAHIAGISPDMAIIKASGERLRDYLQGQVTQDIRRLDSECGIYACVLTPQGRPVVDAYIMQEDDSDAVLMLVSAPHAERLVGRLRQFMLGYTLRIGIVSTLAVITVLGPEADAVMTGAGLPLPGRKSLATAHQSAPEVHAMRLPQESDPDGAWIILPRDAAAACLERIGHAVDAAVLDATRILRGRPRFGVDWDERVYPLNAGLTERHGVSFDKGCYVGQEVTSRMHWRKGVKWRLYRVRLPKPPSSLPCPVCTTATVGQLTSLVRIADDGCRGIAHLRIEAADKPLHLEDGTPVELV